MEYQQRIIVFIDILGFKEIIKSEKPINIANYIKLLYETEPSKFRFIESKERLDEQITYFSDCIVISYLQDKNQNSTVETYDFQHFVSTLISLQYLMIRDYNQLIRGAICCGKLIHNNDFCFGPALVKAYECESKKTKFPRIYMENELVKKHGAKTNFDDCLIEENGLYFIDPIKHLFNYLNVNKDCNPKCWHEDTWWAFYNFSRLIEKGLTNTDNRIREKFEYLAKSYNEYLKIFFTENSEREFIMFPNKLELRKKLDYIIGI